MLGARGKRMSIHPFVQHYLRSGVETVTVLVSHGVPL